MERRNESVGLEALKDMVAKLENDLERCFRRNKVLLSENKELREHKQKTLHLFVRERSKSTSKKKVAGWRKVNPEGLKKLQNSKAGLTWERVAPKILEAFQNQGENLGERSANNTSREMSLKRLSKTVDLLERIPR